MKHYIQFNTIEDADIAARTWSKRGYVAMNGDMWPISDYNTDGTPLGFTMDTGRCGIDYSTSRHFTIFSVEDRLLQLSEIDI